MSDKTEQPTPRRLRRARDEGDSGASAYASQAAAFVVAVLVAPSAVRATVAGVARDLRTSIASIADPTAVVRSFDPVPLAVQVATLVLPIVAATAATATVVQAIQTGGVVASKRIAPGLGRLDPIAGMRSLFSGPRAFAVVRALVAAVAVSTLAYGELRAHVVDLAHLVGKESRTAAAISTIAGSLAIASSAVGLVLAVIDVIVTRRSWMRRLRMTKEDVRREHRDAEGDPQLKAARERAHHEMLNQATVASVKNATVVVVNPTHIACALRYEDTHDVAPAVVTKGEGELAARISKAARDWGVPIVRDVPLARALAELEIGDVIPEALYEAVAEILREIRGPGAA